MFVTGTWEISGGVLVVQVLEELKEPAGKGEAILDEQRQDASTSPRAGEAKGRSGPAKPQVRATQVKPEPERSCQWKLEPRSRGSCC